MRPSLRASRPARPAGAAFWVAAVLGSLHAAASAYWALGGLALLETVGPWAAEAARSGSLLVPLGLGLITVVKLAAAWIPLLAEQGRIAGRRVWRAISWVGGPLLVVYGLVGVVGGVATLLGRGDLHAAERTGAWGHAVLWDPLFALWGAALTVGLVTSRRRRAAG